MRQFAHLADARTPSGRYRAAVQHTFKQLGHEVKLEMETL